MSKPDLKMGNIENMKETAKQFTKVLKQPISKKISDFLNNKGKNEKIDQNKKSAANRKEDDLEL